MVLFPKQRGSSRGVLTSGLAASGTEIDKDIIVKGAAIMAAERNSFLEAGLWDVIVMFTLGFYRESLPCRFWQCFRDVRVVNLREPRDDSDYISRISGCRFL